MPIGLVLMALLIAVGLIVGVARTQGAGDPPAGH